MLSLPNKPKHRIGELGTELCLLVTVVSPASGIFRNGRLTSPTDSGQMVLKLDLAEEDQHPATHPAVGLADRFIVDLN